MKATGSGNTRTISGCCSTTAQGMTPIPPPEAARLAAQLYAELDENSRALEMYRRFIDRYGAEARVRVADVEGAYAALTRIYARLADYAAQARLLVEESEQTRLPGKTRAAAAQKARQLRRARDGQAQLGAQLD